MLFLVKQIFLVVLMSFLIHLEVALKSFNSKGNKFG